MQEQQKQIRLFQDYQFEVIHLQGSMIEELIGVVDEDCDDLQPILLLLKPASHPWQRFFLDIGAGFWEQWPATAIEQERANDSYKCIDYADRFALRGAGIQKISCQPMGENLNSLIALHLSCGTFLLLSQNAHDRESPSAIVFLGHAI